MAKFSAIARDDVAAATSYAAPSRTARGVVWSKRVSPDGYSIWMVEAELADRAEIVWSGPHSDDGLYVVSGELEVTSPGQPTRRCPAEGAVIVENGTGCVVRAMGPTRVVHVGAYDDSPPQGGLYGSPADDGQAVIVVGDKGWYQSGNGDNYLARWFADSTQPSSRIAFFHVALPLPHRRDVPHTHTEDELIYVMDGSIVMGKQEYCAGTCLAIPGKVHYSVTTGANGVKFLNYRRDASIQEYGKVKEPELESAIVRGGRLVGDLRLTRSSAALSGSKRL